MMQTEYAVRTRHDTFRTLDLTHHAMLTVMECSCASTARLTLRLLCTIIALQEQPQEAEQDILATSLAVLALSPPERTMRCRVAVRKELLDL